MKQVIDRRLAVVGVVLCVLGWAAFQVMPTTNPLLSTVPCFAVYMIGAALIGLAVIKE
jgi:predicted acyltransferase